MKRKGFMMLQLFAEPEGAETEVVETKTPETEESEEKGEEKKYTEKEVDEILNRKFARWQKNQEKAVSEAKKLSEMDAQQKAEYEKEKLQKELEEYKKRETLSDMTKEARKMLSENGINISDDLLSMMVSTEAEQTKAAVDSFTSLFNDAVEAAVKERLKGESPKKGSGTPETMTKEQILAIKDPELRQKKMLENRSLFNF